MLCSGYCFRYSQTFILNLIWNSSWDALYWWTIHVSLLSPENQWMTVTRWLSCLCWNFVYEDLHYLYLFWLHCPMVLCVVSTTCITLNWCTLISGLVKFISERSLSRKKSEFLSKVVCVVTLRLPFTTLGIFWVLTLILY